MRGDLLYQSLGDLAEIDDQLRRNDPATHETVARVLRSLTAEQLAGEGRTAKNLIRWLTPAERHELAATRDPIDLRRPAAGKPGEAPVARDAKRLAEVTP